MLTPSPAKPCAPAKLCLHVGSPPADQPQWAQVPLKSALIPRDYLLEMVAVGIIEVSSQALLDGIICD